jgi:hypothetical protein
MNKLATCLLFLTTYLVPPSHSHYKKRSFLILYA